MADVMRRTRAGMGYCQGFDCALGVLEIFIEGRGADPLPALEDILKERQRGQRLASGDQLRQEVLRHHILFGVYGLEEER